MSDLKKSVSKMPKPLYEMTYYADVRIDGVALDWRDVDWACERLNIVCLSGDTGRLFQVGRDTGVLLNIDGALLFGNVAITNVVEKLDVETAKRYLISAGIPKASISNPKYYGYCYGPGIQNKCASLWRKIMNSLRPKAQGDL